MFKVKNKSKEERKFRDHNTGRDVIVGPGQEVETDRPPEESEVWAVQKSKQPKESEDK